MSRSTFRSALAIMASIAVAVAVWIPTVGLTTTGGEPPVPLVSLSVSPSDVTTGGTSKGTVTVGLTKALATVQLASADPRLAVVPPSVTISGGTDRQSFSVRTINGATGCTELSATMEGVTRRASIFVLPHPTPSSSPVTVSVPASAFGGQTLSGFVDVVGGSVGNYTVQLGSSHPALATVPASVTMMAWPSSISGTGTNTELVVKGRATFPITTTLVDAAKCSVITATLHGTTSRVLIKILPLSG